MKLKTIVKVLAGLLILLVALMTAAVLSADWLLKSAVVATVRQQTGFPFAIDKLRVGLLDGTLRVQGLTLGNPPGFGDQPLVSLPELYLAYDLMAAQTNALRFREVRVNLDQLSMVIDAEGRTNLTEIAARFEKAGLSGSRPVPTNMLGGMTFAGIDRLQLSLGQVNLTDLRAGASSRTIRMGITNESFTNVVDLTPLVPLAFRIMAKTMFQLR